MPDKGFTATFISNTGKTLRQYNISGWKLYFVRALMGLFVLLVLGAAIIVLYGFINIGKTERMREEISQLQDSLAQRRYIEARLESIEGELQQLYEYRQRLENIAAMISTPEDSLEQ